MTEVERRRTVAASPGAVWTLLADYGGIVAWASNVDHSCLLTDQESGVGAVRRIQSGRTALVETVRSWVPDEELSYEITGLPKVVRSVVSTWRIVPDDAGSVVTLTSAIDAGPRPPQRLIAKIAGRKLAEAADEMLAGLATHLDFDRSPATREETAHQERNNLTRSSGNEEETTP